MAPRHWPKPCRSIHMLRSTTISIRSVTSSAAKFTNKDAQPRWPSGALSQPNSRMLCHAHWRRHQYSERDVLAHSVCICAHGSWRLISSKQMDPDGTASIPKTISIASSYNLHTTLKHDTPELTTFESLWARLLPQALDRHRIAWGL
jgi:hypothetical protein